MTEPFWAQGLNTFSKDQQNVYGQEPRCYKEGRGGAVVRLLASHPGESGSIHGGFAPESSHAEIVTDDATDCGGSSRRSPATAFRHRSIFNSPHPDKLESRNQVEAFVIGVPATTVLTLSLVVPLITPVGSRLQESVGRSHSAGVCPQELVNRSQPAWDSLQGVACRSWPVGMTDIVVGIAVWYAHFVWFIGLVCILVGLNIRLCKRSALNFGNLFVDVDMPSDQQTIASMKYDILVKLLVQCTGSGRASRSGDKRLRNPQRGMRDPYLRSCYVVLAGYTSVQVLCNVARGRLNKMYCHRNCVCVHTFKSIGYVEVGQKLLTPMSVIEVSIAGETGDPPERKPTDHDSQMRKSGVTRPGIEPGSPWWEERKLTAQPPIASRETKDLFHISSGCTRFTFGTARQDRLFAQSRTLLMEILSARRKQTSGHFFRCFASLQRPWLAATFSSNVTRKEKGDNFHMEALHAPRGNKDIPFLASHFYASFTFPRLKYVSGRSTKGLAIELAGCGDAGLSHKRTAAKDRKFDRQLFVGVGFPGLWEGSRSPDRTQTTIGFVDASHVTGWRKFGLSEVKLEQLRLVGSDWKGVDVACSKELAQDSPGAISENNGKLKSGYPVCGIEPAASRLRLNLLDSHQGELSSISGRITPGFSHVGIGQDEVAGQWVSSGISHFPPFIPTLVNTQSPSSALKTAAACQRIGGEHFEHMMLNPDCLMPGCTNIFPDPTSNDPSSESRSNYEPPISAVRNERHLDLQSISELKWCNSFLCRSKIRSRIEFRTTMVEPGISVADLYSNQPASKESVSNLSARYRNRQQLSFICQKIASSHVTIAEWSKALFCGEPAEHMRQMRDRLIERLLRHLTAKARRRQDLKEIVFRQTNRHWSIFLIDSIRYNRCREFSNIIGYPRFLFHAAVGLGFQGEDSDRPSKRELVMVSQTESFDLPERPCYGETMLHGTNEKSYISGQKHCSRDIEGIPLAMRWLKFWWTTSDNYLHLEFMVRGIPLLLDWCGCCVGRGHTPHRVGTGRAICTADKEDCRIVWRAEAVCGTAYRETLQPVVPALHSPHCIFFADHSRFNFNVLKGHGRIWCRSGQFNDPTRICDLHTSRTPCFMVWDTISYGSWSRRLVVEGIGTPKQYVDEVLPLHFLTFLLSIPKVIMHQDNARSYTARITQQALQDVDIITWPGRISHFSHYACMRKGAWWYVPQDTIRHLYDGMSRHIAASVSAR
ncbi:hypothetical protein PR048_013647 [Dryococelus australis]|uniref:Uncharacterized protein n=1 Tax=Dryococelus australis TaxID=614101 RepID=A0ABQ9HSR5_9NEOP|nr:hypothetical protein PR048_013647 [Dryococelus australis]